MTGISCETDAVAGNCYDAVVAGNNLMLLEPALKLLQERSDAVGTGPEDVGTV